MYGEDPTVAALEQRVADLLGHEAALFMPSGTLANQIGMRLHVAPGQEVLCDATRTSSRAEMGAAAAFSGITTRTWAAPRGRLDAGPAAGADAARRRCLPGVHRGGRGREHAQPRWRHGPAAAAPYGSCGRRRRERGVALHLDGARLWNAHVATGIALAAYGELVDTVSVCL